MALPSNSSWITRAVNGEELDFDQEAHKLWNRLNLQAPPTSSQWNPVDPIYKHPTGNGIIYVGNQKAAQNLSYLRSLGITHVVNCTHGFSKIPDFHEGKLKYYNFAISHWPNFVNSTNASVIAFAGPMFAFIEKAIANGGSVLVHCLAGAHRAGTTGCACLMYFAGMDVATAIAVAKKLRPIIDPIGQLPDFLVRLKRAYDAQDATKSLVETVGKRSPVARASGDSSLASVLLSGSPRRSSQEMDSGTKASTSIPAAGGLLLEPVKDSCIPISERPSIRGYAAAKRVVEASLSARGSGDGTGVRQGLYRLSSGAAAAGSYGSALASGALSLVCGGEGVATKQRSGVPARKLLGQDGKPLSS